ncbi:MAG: hypothetical protein IPI02_21265 [Sterolibacteriaceae bacterium]|nr:hypothetical protein [Sterolibacteriaceae bacterium]
MNLVIPWQHKARQARTSEEHAWDTLYRTKHDPTAATEVVEYLDSEPEVRKAHLGLYLCCRQTVRAHEARRVHRNASRHSCNWPCIWFSSFRSALSCVPSGVVVTWRWS